MMYVKKNLIFGVSYQLKKVTVKCPLFPTEQKVKLWSMKSFKNDTSIFILANKQNFASDTSPKLF